MTFIRLIALVVLAFPVIVSTQMDVAGEWRAVFTGPMGLRPKMVDAVTFTIRTTPNGLTGTARASNWPGDLDVSDMTLEGNRLTFTGTGEQGSSTTYAGVRTEHCCPKLIFHATVSGDNMDILLTWTSTDSEVVPTKPPLPMKATRTSR